MYLLVNDNLEYVRSNNTLGPREQALRYMNALRAMTDSNFRARELDQEIAVIDANDDDFVIYVASPDD